MPNILPMASYGLQGFHEKLAFAYHFDLIDDEEFGFLFESSFSRGVVPYWKFDKFDFDTWDKTDSLVA